MTKLDYLFNDLISAMFNEKSKSVLKGKELIKTNFEIVPIKTALNDIDDIVDIKCININGSFIATGHINKNEINISKLRDINLYINDDAVINYKLKDTESLKDKLKTLLH